MNDCWRGKRIALTGRFASMDRPTTRRLIANLGANATDRVTRKTSALIVGSDGWPLKKAGKPTRNLRLAARYKRQGSAIAVISEAAFLERLGVAGEDDPIRRLYTVEQVSEMVHVSGLRLRRWVAAGLLQPKETREGIALFSFRQVASIRDMWRLIASGCDTKRLLKTVRRLSELMPDEIETLGELQRFGKAIVTRIEDGTLVDAYGQRLLPFDEVGPCDALSWFDGFAEQRDPDTAFGLAVRLEAVSKEKAIEAYQNWLDRFGPDACVLFNRANLLAAQGQFDEALREYRRGLDVDESDPRIWNNMALTLAQLGQLADASRAFEQAMRRDPNFKDAYFNAADVLEERGLTSSARLMWMRYLAHDNSSEYAAYARSRCDQGVTSVVDDS